MNPYVLSWSRYHAATSVTPVGAVQAALTGPLVTWATGTAAADGKTGNDSGTPARIGPHGVEIDGVREASGEADDPGAVEAVGPGVTGVGPQAVTRVAASRRTSREAERRQVVGRMA